MTQRQPTALYVLALTEAWERFSYYGMRAILILYLTEYLLLPGAERPVAGLGTLRHVLGELLGPQSDQALSSQIYGLYTGFAYFTPMVGGLIADRWLGQRRSVIIGGLLMAAGQFVLTRDDLFLLGLALLVSGNGLFKPNIVSQVGGLYAAGDPRRDRAYSTFYVGINLGACIAPLVCGTIAQYYGWHAGFAAGGSGMLLGLAIFIGGRRWMPAASIRQAVPGRTSPPAARRAEIARRIAFLAMLGLLLSLYFALFEQIGNVFSLWVRDHTNHGAIPVSWFQSAMPMLLITLTPLLVFLWERQGRRGAERSTMAKIGQGFALTALAYLSLGASQAASGENMVPWTVVIPFLAIMAWGELHVAPTSLSLFSRIAPPRLISTMMGIYFLSNFGGNVAAGMLGAYWSTTDPSRYWFTIAAFAGLGALASLVLMTPANRFLASRGIGR